MNPTDGEGVGLVGAEGSVKHDDRTQSSTPGSDRFAIREGMPWIGDRSFPWAEEVQFKDHDDYHRRVIHLRFENGWLLSVSFGSFCYGTNHDAGLTDTVFVEEPPLAECWGWWGRGDHYWDLNGGEVLGYQTTDDVLRLIDEMQTWSTP